MSGGDICMDGRFELIAKAREKLVDATNIEERPQEMAVLDSILFRCWQMGWLDRLETCRITKDEHGFLTCSECGATQPEDYTVYYCWCCGRHIKGD